MVVGRKLLVEVRMTFPQRVGSLEKHLRHDSKKLWGVGCSVRIDVYVPAFFQSLFEVVELTSEDTRPGGVVGTGLELRGAVYGAAFCIQLMRELVKDHILSVVRIQGSTLDVIPRKDDLAPTP